MSNQQNKKSDQRRQRESEMIQHVGKMTSHYFSPLEVKNILKSPDVQWDTVRAINILNQRRQNSWSNIVRPTFEAKPVVEQPVIEKPVTQNQSPKNNNGRRNQKQGRNNNNNKNQQPQLSKKKNIEAEPQLDIAGVNALEEQVNQDIDMITKAAQKLVAISEEINALKSDRESKAGKLEREKQELVADNKMLEGKFTSIQNRIREIDSEINGFEQQTEMEFQEILRTYSQLTN
eukprot:TRINITY_DN2832_c0_g1_i2.p1 TRINITY_DN2832_c0_g1~~TRINITY_DN2832_c0_g1_i2.p1  ORF type:complete len:244 (+),score=72.38 TRINITY_DN2832_c0_g1_i2:35-733(+)